MAVWIRALASSRSFLTMVPRAVYAPSGCGLSFTILPDRGMDIGGALVVRTTGAGDAAAAGFLLALLDGLSPEDAATMAGAVGATNLEAPDATGGVRS